MCVCVSARVCVRVPVSTRSSSQSHRHSTSPNPSNEPNERSRSPPTDSPLPLLQKDGTIARRDPSLATRIKAEGAHAVEADRTMYTSRRHAS